MRDYGRRNLSPYDRSVLALKLEPLYTAEAERRHAANGGDHGNQYTGGKVADVQNSALPPDKGKTRDKVAAAAGVSRHHPQGEGHRDGSGQGHQVLALKSEPPRALFKASYTQVTHRALAKLHTRPASTPEMQTGQTLYTV